MVVKNKVTSYSGIVLCVAGLLFQQPSGNDILRKMEQLLAPVEDYTVDLQIEVDMERLRIPRMKATLYFKKPDKVHFATSGFAMLPREGFTLNPTWLREHFDAQRVGQDTLNGRIVQKLQLDAKGRSTRMRQLFLWVDTQRWTIEKFETTPYQGRNLLVTFHQTQQPGGIFLPDTMSAVFGFTVQESDSTSALDQYQPQLQQVMSQMRSGSMTVVYSNYRINTGLSDEIFEKKESGAKEQR